MEFIIAALVSILTQAFKKLSERFGYKATKNAVVLAVFVLAFAGAVLKMKGVISTELIDEVMKIGALSIAMYEVIYKRVLKPIIEKK